MRLLAAAAIAATLSACTIETFETATQSVNEEFALAQQLRDRCSTSGNVDHCLAWQQFRAANESPGYNYDAALDRWIANGPY